MTISLAEEVTRLLHHHGMPVCIVGEFALNYYNAPRICHDLEVCVPKSSSILAAALLCATGVFEPCDADHELNNYTMYKRGFPRLRTTASATAANQQSIVIFTAPFYGLEPIENALVSPVSDRKVHISKEMADMGCGDITTLPIPRLPLFLAGQAARFLHTRDDVAMIAVEQLVDGMNLDEQWVNEKLADSDLAVRNLIMDRVITKASRIDYYSDNEITCFIRDEAEAQDVRLIPGYE